MTFKKFSSSEPTGFEENILDKYQNLISSDYHTPTEDEGIYVKNGTHIVKKGGNKKNKESNTSSSKSYTSTDYSFSSTTNNDPTSNVFSTEPSSIYLSHISEKSDNNSTSSIPDTPTSTPTITASTTSQEVKPCFNLSSSNSSSSSSFNSSSSSSSSSSFNSNDKSKSSSDSSSKDIESKSSSSNLNNLSSTSFEFSSDKNKLKPEPEQIQEDEKSFSFSSSSSSQSGGKQSSNYQGIGKKTGQKIKLSRTKPKTTKTSSTTNVPTTSSSESTTGITTTSTSTSTSTSSSSSSPSSSNTSSDQETNLSINKQQDDYIPRIFNMPSQSQSSIFDLPLKLNFNNNVPFPQFSLGFQHYIHQSKNNFQKINNFSGRIKPYLVLHKFEKQIDEYEGGLEQLSRSYFKLDSKYNIIDRSFYKMWEIITLFNLINPEEKNFTSAHLAEAPGSFLQATMLYRDKFCIKNNCKDDTYVAQTLLPEVPSKIIKAMDPIINTYTKEKPQRTFIMPTAPLSESEKNATKSNGNLTKLKDIKLFIKYFKDTSKNLANFVTFKGSVEWTDRIVQEQELTPLVIGGLYAAINILAKGGNFVCRIFESYTEVMGKIIYLFSTIFNSVNICKPLTSHKSSSEKYLVCIGFKDEIKNKMNKVLEEIIIGLETQTKKFLNNLFPEFTFPNNFRSSLINSNIDIANRQFQGINEIITFIEEQNYRGDEYTKRRAMQIAATKYWSSVFFTENIKEQSRRIKDFTDEIVTMNNGKSDILNKKIKY